MQKTHPGPPMPDRSPAPPVREVQENDQQAGPTPTKAEDDSAEPATAPQQGAVLHPLKPGGIGE